MTHPSSRRRVTLAVIAIAALAGCAGNGNKPAATAQTSGPPTFEGKAPSGYVDMDEVQVAYLGNAGGGHGTLTFQGQTHHFDIGGLGVGGIGISKVDAKGEVYDLTDLKQFSGAYGQIQYGAVAGTASIGDLWLKNDKGVVMHLKAKREGLMLAVGADVIDVHMTQ